MLLGCWIPAQAPVLCLLHFFTFSLHIHHSEVDQQFEENLGADFGALSLRFLFAPTFCSSNPIFLVISEFNLCLLRSVRLLPSSPALFLLATIWKMPSGQFWGERGVLLCASISLGFWLFNVTCAGPPMPSKIIYLFFQL